MDGKLARVIDARSAEHRARGLPRRSRRHVVLAVALACTAIVGAHVPAVSATGMFGAPAHRRATQTFRYYMDVSRPRNTLCLGESAVYTLFVYRDATTGPSSPSAVDGVKVEAYAADPNVGTFIGKQPGKQWTGPGLSDEPTLSADFTFKAGKKPGKTTLVFQGAVRDVDIHVGYVSFNVDIKVIQCKYTVSGSTSFPPNGRDNPDIVYPRLIAKLKKVQLVSDADGHLTGSTTIHWKSASLSSGCVVNETFSADGQVTINGDVADEVLTLTFAFTSVAGFATETCGPASVSNTYPYQIDPLTIGVPTKGGVVTPKITQSGFPGVASIVVKPVKEG